MNNGYFEDPFLKILPKLDLHGETRDTIISLVLDFLNVNLIMKKYKVQIVHGRHGGIIKNELHYILKNLKGIDRYYIYNMNDGVTIIELDKTCEKITSKLS